MSENCGKCNLPNRPDGHDACLGVIAGAMNACCGHGDDAMAYVQPVGCTCAGNTSEQTARGHVCAAHVDYFGLDPSDTEATLYDQLKRATLLLMPKLVILQLPDKVLETVPVCAG